MRIVLDGMGGDNAPDEIVKGAVETSASIDHEICIVGDRERIEPLLDTFEYDAKKICVLHASEVIGSDDSPVKAVRRKKDSSLVKGMEAVRDGEGDIFISAGNSGAIMSGGVFVLGRIRGIDRPAIGSTYPILGQGEVSLLIDTGANAECKPHNLLQFAMMGSIYAQSVLGKERPTVGLVNIGTEPGKGSAMLKETFELLMRSRDGSSGLNFIGNVEARDVPIGICDVIVCDGFVGNVILKMTEGVALSISHLIRRKFSEGVVAKAGAVLLYNKLGELKKAFDYTEYGGAPILGVKGAVVKLHGSATANAVRSGITRAIPFVENRVVDTIERAMGELSEITGDVDKS
ncbi:MAG: phosphate acyltransferase PlsX [Clostridiales Family XIII bacterium]|jgi:glycerol-3-phosphate acyltransferase PlsX|nr:phosphate acyltransferase PlsX [Clostridiales Family XIII bacterium]